MHMYHDLCVVRLTGEGIAWSTRVSQNDSECAGRIALGNGAHAVGGPPGACAREWGAHVLQEKPTREVTVREKGARDRTGRLFLGARRTQARITKCRHGITAGRTTSVIREPHELWES